MSFVVDGVYLEVVVIGVLITITPYTPITAHVVCDSPD
jgi:hypothetical protein